MPSNAGSETQPPPLPSSKVQLEDADRIYFSEVLTSVFNGGIKSNTIYEHHEAMVEGHPLARTYESSAVHKPCNFVPVTRDPALEPKVICAYETASGGMPRKLEVERKKRLFAAQDLQSLLEARGVGIAGALQSRLGLPLDAFDNVEYELRDPEAWIRLATSRQPPWLPCLALAPDGKWQHAHVIGVGNTDINTYRVCFADNDDEGRDLHRLGICFAAEDPFNFANRRVEAHDRRKYAEQCLLHNLFLDSMPSKDLKPLDAELCARILALAMNTTGLRSADLDTDKLVSEANLDYVRALNKLSFACAFREHDVLEALDHSDEFLGGDPPDAINVVYSTTMTTAPPSAGDKRHPPHTRTPPPSFNFCKARENFRFQSFLTRPEIVRIIVASRTECLKMVSVPLFALLNKPVRVEDFSNAQQETCASASVKLRENWPATVCSHIRQHLKDIKKGWFNLDQANNEVYTFSKLKKFLQSLNLLMQDSLRFAVLGALSDYSRFISSACDVFVHVVSTHDVRNVQQNHAQIRRSKPLFLVDVIAQDGDFAYSTSPSEFIECPLRHFDQAIAAVQGIVQIERRCMTKLFWSHDPLMTSVHPTEVADSRDQLRIKLTRAIEPLDSYLQTYDIFKGFLNLDIDKYLAQAEQDYGGSAGIGTQQQLLETPRDEDEIYGAENDDSNEQLPNVLALAKLAAEHLEAMAQVGTAIPKEPILVGAFGVSGKQVAKLLAEKHAKIAAALYDLAAAKTHCHAERATRAFMQISHRLSVKPSDIETLTELRAYKDSVPQQVAKLTATIEEAVAYFDVLDAALIKTSRPRVKWQLMGFPKQIADKCAEVEDMCKRLEQDFEQQMDEQQRVFKEELRSYAEDVDQLKTITDLNLVDQVAAHVRRIKRDIEAAEEKARLFNSREGLFRRDATDFTSLLEVAKKFEPFFALWDHVDRWLAAQKEWRSAPFLEICAEAVDAETTAIARALTKCQKFFTAPPTTADFDEASLSGCLDVTRTVLAQVDKFKPRVPLLISLKQEGMRERHWELLSERVGKPVRPDDTYTIETVFALDLDESYVAHVSEIAAKEYAIETALEAMMNAWEEVPLQIERYRDTGTSILRGIDDYTALLDEQITTTQAMTFSAFKGPFEQRINAWNNTLQVVSELIEEWVAVQKNWLYLAPIFSSADINKQLPVEGKRFATVDKHWRHTLAAASTPGTLAIYFCNDAKLLDRFRESNKLLDLVQRGLSDYLEQKRSGFSRFFFLSDGDLLEILSETKNPTNVQPHLRKCFEGIKMLKFADELLITDMVSSEGEIVKLERPIDPKGKNIEDWMAEINVTMCRSVRDHMVRAVQAYPTAERTVWMLDWPSQVVLNGSQVHWTAEVEVALRDKGNNGLRDYHEQAIMQLNDMVYLIRSGLSKGQRTTVGALAVIDVHARDVVKQMCDDDVMSTNDFEWQSQMRFYWEGDLDQAKGDLFVVQVAAKRSYGYEYLGNSLRLVITPLTDKCYLTLMGALQMNLGGAPAGPAGTGKLGSV